jgi:hypothetical protein
MLEINYKTVAVTDKALKLPNYGQVEIQVPVSAVLIFPSISSFYIGKYEGQ